jgi:GTP cyclohydrolase I
MRVNLCEHYALPFIGQANVGWLRHATICTVGMFLPLLTHSR